MRQRLLDKLLKKYVVVIVVVIVHHVLKKQIIVESTRSTATKRADWRRWPAHLASTFS
jgi:hypothetical protein